MVFSLSATMQRSKCHKNFKMKRNPRKVKWTKAYRAAHGKDMTQDKTFEFEKKRNRPERYDRNVTENTLTAIKKIDKIRSARASKYIEKRLKPNKQKIYKEDIKVLDNDIVMIKAPQQVSEKIKVDVSKKKSVQNEAMEE
ncbi:probable ribosome biogenesis protein RLP24 isoform X2 [Eutrema salsugineum]|uniref:probable ribosome biogenesis protein RLP24 isoform X2 n=1 Tax=Eutrema salsugineum TaxID=72664 RepID=UPI000CED4905|nr:probable ribosome biogenesis protein RLP24 isoform X2 [Eutrema salsugineum]XP_024008855.1 probable ribosome biogenesis protein RLP24 isoform X2 [Eutrema salsugineum]